MTAVLEIIAGFSAIGQFIVLSNVCWVITWANGSSMLSPLVMSNLDWFSPGTQRVPSLMCRGWMWHHKSNGDSRATDHRGQNRAHRKSIPSPQSHCPHWCLFKLGSDTKRDYFSIPVPAHSTHASNTLSVSFFYLWQQNMLGHWVLGGSNQTYSDLLCQTLIGVAHVISGIKTGSWLNEMLFDFIILINTQWSSTSTQGESVK